MSKVYDSSSLQFLLPKLHLHAEDPVIGDKDAWVYLDDKGNEVEKYTYKQLAATAQHLASQLIPPGNAKSPYNLKAGDRVLLVFFPGLTFTVALLACFYCGLIAVPVFPPDPRHLNKDIHHFISITNSSGSKVVLTNNEYNFLKKLEGFKSLFSSSSVTWPDLKWIPIDDYINQGKQKKYSAENSVKMISKINFLKDVAFLQYTSGSTSEPKGVIISHVNLSHNISITQQELKTDTNTINVSWLPQYHDMGLIGSYLGLINCGGTGYFISPISFIKNPLLWIDLLSKYKATHTQAPNFAYALVARKFEESLSHYVYKNKKDEVFDYEQLDKYYENLYNIENKSNKERLGESTDPGSSENKEILTKSSSNTEKKKEKIIDLSSLYHAINAAEPVDYAAIQKFYHIFSFFSLKNNTIVPTYGLAEHTVFVCTGGQTVLEINKDKYDQNIVEVYNEYKLDFDYNLYREKILSREAENNYKIISCGIPRESNDIQFLIYDQETNSIAPDLKVGEIWLNSPSKSRGYWNVNPEDIDDDVNIYEIETSDVNGEDVPKESSIQKSNQVTKEFSRNFLKTGDLGFLYKGELFVSGRIKDLIIINGTNYYPQDIEKIIENSLSDYLRPGCSAAFAVFSPIQHTEQIVYIAELKDNIDPTKTPPPRSSSPSSSSSAFYHAIINNIRDVVTNSYGVSLATICLLKSRSIPKTTSGKIARSWCKNAFVNNKLNLVYRSNMVPVNGSNSSSAPSSSSSSSHDKHSYTPQQIRDMSIKDIERKLENTLFKISSVGPNPIDPSTFNNEAPLISYGLDSITLVQFKGVIENKFHCELPDEFIYSDTANIKQLSIAVKQGKLLPSQLEAFQNNTSIDTPANGVPIPAKVKQPCCPWFTCCIR